MSRFEAANPLQEAYEAKRRDWIKLHPFVTRQEIEANTPEVPLMTPEEIIAAGAKLIVKG